MTAKEKAKELIDKYDILESQNTYFQKTCTLICVEQILQSCKYQHILFWQEVKQELNNL